MNSVLLGAPTCKPVRACIAAVAVALAASASTVVAAPLEASRPLAELFPGLDRYWRTPEAKRTMFRMRYCVQGAAGDLAALRLHYAAHEGDRIFETDQDGCFAAVPGLADLKANPLALAAASDAAFKVIVALEPTTPLKRVIPMAHLRAAIQQADDAARTAAGPFAWGAPHLDSVHFDLDDEAPVPSAHAQDHSGSLQSIRLEVAPAGYAIFQDGSRRALPVRDGRVMVAPSDPAFRKAQWIELAADPLNARIGFSTPIKR